jgi:hypothetical protein
MWLVDRSGGDCGDSWALEVKSTSSGVTALGKTFLTGVFVVLIESDTLRNNRNNYAILCNNRNNTE